MTLKEGIKVSYGTNLTVEDVIDQMKKGTKQEIKPSMKFQKRQVDPNQTFACVYCQQVFPTCQSLGGHISRQHPKTSESFQKKMDRRKERTFDRQLLVLAKLEHTNEFGPDAALNRNKIRRYKK